MSISPATALFISPPARLLLVDPDLEAQRWTETCLRPHGHDVHATEDADAIEQARQRGFDLVLMDPAARAGRGTRHGHDAWQRLRGLRDQCHRLPVLVLQAGALSSDRTVALELGADAVLDKPCDPRELRARVSSLLRRHQESLAPPQRPLEFGPWSLDVAQRCLRAPTGLRLPLSPEEFSLLRNLLLRPRSGLSRLQLLDLACAGEVEMLGSDIGLWVEKLRRKLADGPETPPWIRTATGVGYLFEALDDARSRSADEPGDGSEARPA